MSQDIRERIAKILAKDGILGTHYTFEEIYKLADLTAEGRGS